MIDGPTPGPRGPRRARRRSQDQARAAPLPAPHPRRAAARRRRRGQAARPNWTGSTCCARPTRTLSTEDIAAGLQAAPRGRTRLARLQGRPGAAPGLPPARGPHPRPRPALLARAAAAPHDRERHRDTWRTTWPRARTELQPARWHSPARPGRARPPHPTPRPDGCTRPSTSPCRRGSSTSTPNSPQRANQPQHRRLVTRHVTMPAPVCPAQTLYPGTFTAQQLRNPGPTLGVLRRPVGSAQYTALRYLAPGRRRRRALDRQHRRQL